MYDMVNHPKHYQSKTGLEVIDVIEAFTDGLEGIEATDTGNIIKYACRWKEKGGIQDLEKIVWYTNHLIEHLKGKEKLYDFNARFETKEDAEKALSILNRIISDYGIVSVVDLADLTGRSYCFDERQYGWTDLSSAKVVRTTEGYAIRLPKAISIYDI